MKRPIVLLVLVVVVIMVLLATCSTPTPTPTPSEGAPVEPPAESNLTDTPTEVIPTNTPTEVIPSETPTDTPPPPTQGTAPSDSELATEFSVIYALADGAAYVLTPRRESLGITAEKLAEDPAALEGQILGRLTVVKPLTDTLPADTYTITLDPTGETMVFSGATGETAFPAVIRSLRLPISAARPVALISSVQMCIAWEALQICANVSTPLPGDLLEELVDGIQQLGADPNSFALDRAVPDIEGDNVVQPCLVELKNQKPDYTKCFASVLAAPALEPLQPPALANANGTGVLAAPVLDALRLQQVEPEITGTAALVVLTDLQLTEDAYSDPQLTQLIGAVPKGNYLMYEFVLPDDPVIGTYDDQSITESRVGLSAQVGEAPQLYLRSVVGAPYLGDPILGAPPDGVEAVISNLWIRGTDNRWHCYFRKRQCP